MRKKAPFFICLGLILLSLLPILLPDLLHLYDTMQGAKGLRNVILALTPQFLPQFLLILFINIVGIIKFFRLFKTRKERHLNMFKITLFLFFIFGFLTLLFWPKSRYFRYYEQTTIRKLHILSKPILTAAAISDLITDDYEEYIINNCDFDAHNHKIRNYARTDWECAADFCGKDGKHIKMQIGRNDYKNLRNSLPYGFDTKITVYKKSGFLRSVEPSVNYTHEESFTHIFDISVSDNKIILKQNADVHIRNLSLHWFACGESDDIENSQLSSGISNDVEHIETSYFDKYSEICLYAFVDGEYHRISNVITEKDIP